MTAGDDDEIIEVLRSDLRKVNTANYWLGVLSGAVAMFVLGVIIGLMNP